MTGKSRWGIVILTSVSYVIYWNWWWFILYILGVISIHPASSGPDMLLLLLKAPTNNWAPSSPTRLTSWAFSSSTDFSLTISCLSTGLNPALSKRSRVAPRRTLSLSAFSARSDSIFNALGAISAKLRCNSSVIWSAHSLRSFQAWFRSVWVSLYPAFFAASKWSPELTYSSTNTCLWLVKLVFAIIHIGFSYSKFIIPKISHPPCRFDRMNI